MKKIFIMLLFFIPVLAFAQKMPDDGFDKIRIAGNDKTIQAELRPITTDPEMETDRLYYWYSGNNIHSTQGGFSGRLLNGQYSEYFANKNLKEMGVFKKGLKYGIWRSWTENGTLIQFYTWEKGLKTGKFSVFDERGIVKQSGTYHHNLLEGPVKTYNEKNQVTIVNYHEGMIVAAYSPSFWDKINIFKKK